MIKANELRIGNYVNEKDVDFNEAGVFFDGNKTIVQVDIDILHRVFGENPCHFERIPLTEDILLKCGFSECESKIIDNPDMLSIQISNNETLDFEDNEFFLAGISSHRVVSLWNCTKHLHQLQNLYFALTGEELTINL
jgi:hypothetical protein